MRYMGKNSISSFLKAVCSIAWYIHLIIGGVLLLGIAVFTIYGPEILPHIFPDFSFKAPGLEIYIDRSVLTVNPLPRWAVVAVFGSAIPFIGVVLVIFYQLKQIFGTLIKEEPFVQENVLRVKKIGITVMVGAVLQSIAEFLIGHFIINHITIEGITLIPRFRLNLQTLLAGLAVLVLAEVLRQATEIKEDQNLTI